MHKHRTDKLPSPQSGRDANAKVGKSVQTYITGLLGELGCRDDVAVEHLSREYLSKYLDENVHTAASRRQKAVEKWLSMETQNAITNGVLRDRDLGWNILPRVSYSNFLRFARRIIADVLGPLNDGVVVGSFSGGASTSSRSASSSPAEKFAGQADITGEAVAYIDILYREAPLLRQYGTFDRHRRVEGAVLFTVPKKSDIDRCACKEPDINMFLQKGVGALIRRRLRRFGINLNDQSVNRRLAQVGSLDNSLATLDLSSASDTITIECVKSLLPQDWFLYLNDIRSQVVDVDGTLVRTEMFSSMGNGFTFELESLLFWALTRTALYFEGVPGIVSVYGDDIICPSEGYDAVCWVLKSFGFKVNPDKSFHDGPFRESCGGHYHHGNDITPFYLKREVTTITDVIRVANQLRRWALADPARQYMVPSTYEVWTQLASFIPGDLWGGRDVASDTQLVTTHHPINRLVRLTKVKKLPAVGSYLQWHSASWKRAVPAEDIGWAAANTLTMCRRRKAPIGAPYLDLVFQQEMLGQVRIRG